MSSLSEYSRILKVLGHPDRIRILRVIKEFGEVCVCELVEALGIGFYSVSRNLKKLKFAGILKESRRGRFIFYSFLDSTKKNFIDCLLSVDDLVISEDIEKFRNVVKGRRSFGLGG